MPDLLCSDQFAYSSSQAVVNSGQLVSFLALPQRDAVKGSELVELAAMRFSDGVRAVINHYTH